MGVVELGEVVGEGGALRVSGGPKCLGDTRVDSVRRTSFWRGDVAIELPGLAAALQLFVFGVVISTWDAQAAAAGS